MGQNLLKDIKMQTKSNMRYVQCGDASDKEKFAKWQFGVKKTHTS